MPVFLLTIANPGVSLIVVLSGLAIHTQPTLPHEVFNQLLETVELSETAGDATARSIAISKVVQSAEVSADRRHRRRAMDALMLLFTRGAVMPADLALITDEPMLRAAIRDSSERLWRAGLPRHEDVQMLAFGHDLLPIEALSVRLPGPILTKLTIRLWEMMLAA